MCLFWCPMLACPSERLQTTAAHYNIKRAYLSAASQILTFLDLRLKIDSVSGLLCVPLSAGDVSLCAPSASLPLPCHVHEGSTVRWQGPPGRVLLCLPH